VARLRERYGLHEVVVVGSVAAPSIRFSGFDPTADWCVHPAYVAVRYGDGRFQGVRKAQHDGFHGALDVIDEIYLCGVGVWMCMTTALTLRSHGAIFEPLDDYVGHGERFQRLQVTSQACGSSADETSTLYVDRACRVRRVDLTTLCGGHGPVTIVRSAFMDFAGLTSPTLLQVFRRSSGGSVIEQAPFLDIEIFDLKYS
jgi:hypothetical protein